MYKEACFLLIMKNVIHKYDVWIVWKSCDTGVDKVVLKTRWLEVFTQQI